MRRSIPIGHAYEILKKQKKISPSERDQQPT